MQTAPIPENEAQRLASLYRRPILDTPPDERFDRITRLAASIFDVPIVLISLVDADRQWFKSCVGIDARETSREVSFCAHAILTDEPLVVTDTTTDERFADNPLVTGELGLRFYAGHPLDDGSGQKLGTLCILDRKPRDLDARQRALLRDLACLVESELSSIQLGRTIEEEREIQRTSAQDYARSRMLLERLPDWVVLMNRDGVFLDISGATGSLSAEHLEAGSNVREVLPREAAELRIAAIERALDTNETQLYEFSLTVDGLLSEREARVVPLLSDEVLVIVRDVTERRAMDRMRDEFVSVVSHELRTPLTSIHGALGLLASGAMGSLPDKPQRMLQIAVENTDRLIRLINDILDVERMKSGAVVLSKEKTNTAVLARRAADVMQSMAADAEVILETRADPIQLVADSDKVVQTLTNLLSNAIKFSKPGGIVRLEVEHRGDEAVFTVADQGRGIPAERLERVFDRFEQVDASDSREKAGTGLGLSICRSIVRQHEGWIEADSTLGRGSTFTFGLPAQGRATTIADAELTAERPARVLLVEDDDDLAGVLVEIFRLHHIDIARAATAAEAKTLALEYHPDLLVLDLVLPDDGYALVEQLRGAELRDVPLVVYTGLELGDADRDRLRLGETEFCTKGRVTPYELEQRVAGLLNELVPGKDAAHA